MNPFYPRYLSFHLSGDNYPREYTAEEKAQRPDHENFDIVILRCVSDDKNKVELFQTTRKIALCNHKFLNPHQEPNGYINFYPLYNVSFNSHPEIMISILYYIETVLAWGQYPDRLSAHTQHLMHYYDYQTKLMILEALNLATEPYAGIIPCDFAASLVDGLVSDANKKNIPITWQQIYDRLYNGPATPMSSFRRSVFGSSLIEVD